MSKALAKKEKNISVTVIRPELNLEKWPIWTPAQSRTKPTLRVLERKKILENGDISVSKVKIDPSIEYGNLTTEDQKVWYALLELWERAGKPQKLVFSLNQLAKTLGKVWSPNTFESLKKSLMRLRISAFSWENSYYDSNTKKTLELLDLFNIINDLHLAKVSEGHKINNERCYCSFSRSLYENLLNNYTKPVYFDTILKIKSGVAQLIYKYLELVMYDKNYYERRSENLFDDIGLDSEEYKKPSARKRILLIAIKELKKIPFPGGFLTVDIEETVDKLDWKLIAKKLSKSSETKFKPQTKPQPTDNKSESVLETLTLKDEILMYFIERFGLRRKATQAELEKADQLIKTHQLNYEMAKHVIDFAKCAAVETNYKPQNFSGILKYVEESLIQYQAKQAKSRIKEEVKNCSFCNDDGFIGVIDQFGRRATMRCPHNAEVLKIKASKEKIKFDFWSAKNPNFIY